MYLLRRCGHRGGHNGGRETDATTAAEIPSDPTPAPLPGKRLTLDVTVPSLDYTLLLRLFGHLPEVDLPSRIRATARATTRTVAPASRQGSWSRSPMIRLGVGAME